MDPRTFVAFDLETTGLNPNRDAIIEFGAVRFQNGAARERFTSFVNPGRPLPVRIQQITGIRPADVADAPPIEKLIPEIIAFLGGRTDAVVAHSAAFDISFLRTAGVKVQTPVLDTHELATILLPTQTSYSLGELCQALAISLPEAHRAAHDAEATADLLLCLLEQIEIVPTATLEALCAAGSESAWGAMLLFQDALRRRQKSHAPAPVHWRSDLSEGEGSSHPAAAIEPSRGRPIAADFLAAAFSSDGPLAADFDGEASAGFERREGQLEMARQALDALNRGDHKIIEAGTGTGKSLAYLLPAAAWATANDSRVVIATNTIPLQDQLLEKELPRVIRILAASGIAESDRARPPVRAMVLKGRSRYLCTRRLTRWLESHAPYSGGKESWLSPLELRFLAKVLVWLPHTRTGDLSELPIHDRREQALAAHVSSSADECSPQRCMARAAPGQRNRIGYARHRDFYLEAHRQAISAHLLVVNHALLLADVAAGGQVLPAYDSLIVDEAHHLESAATEQFTQHMDLRVLNSLLDGMERAISQFAIHHSQDAIRTLSRQLAADRRSLQTSIPVFFNALLDFVLRHSESGADRSPSARKSAGKGTRASSGYPQRVALDNRLRAQPEWSEIEISWDDVSAQIVQLLGHLTELAAQLDAPSWDRGRPAAALVGEAPADTESEARSRALQTLNRVQTDLAGLLQVADDVILRPLHLQKQSVAWLELNDRLLPQGGPDAVVLSRAPIQVSEKLAADLFGNLRAVVLTGATLQAGDRFDYLRDRLGCWDASGTVIDSPFDYKRNVLLYLPSDMPTPDRHDYQHALEQAILHAALAAGGRTLVLFTSHSHLRASAEAIRAPLADAGLQLLQQGQGSRRRNLRDFRANPRSLLLGTSSYWEGIDLPGEQLVCLLIARLPFAVPTDPLNAARSRLYEDAFHEYAVPEAVIRLRQGFGRLIRRASDRGVVVLLDSRLWQRSYGEFFLDALPPCTTHRSPLSHLEESVRAWLTPAQEPATAADRQTAPAPWGIRRD